MSIRARLVLAFAVVAVVTAAVALNLALVYVERRIAGLPPDVAVQVERQLEAAGGDFDGLAELSVVVAASLAAGLTIAVLLARRLSAPVRSVARAARLVADGDLTARAHGRAGRDELGRLVADFNAMASGLEGLERERAVSSVAIAHELRTPLAAMMARLQALHDGVLPYTDEEPARLLRHTGVLQRLVDDLRTLSLADAGRLRLDLATTDLRAGVAEGVDAQAVAAAAQQVTLTLADLPAEPVLVRLDADRLTQVLANLVDNAVRHTPAYGVVTVSLAVVDRWARVTVDDTGPGIPPADRERVFDRFTQLDPAARGPAGSSGLGLALVRALVTAQDGRIDLTESPSGGTRVEVRLPLADQEAG